MLQQTQVATVIRYYYHWLKRFPTLNDLANADGSEVLLAWQGLGYYNRARNLHKCAKIIVFERNGKFPSAVDELLALPGIGRYTAGAIASFAFDQPAPIVDANNNAVALLFHHLGEAAHLTFDSAEAFLTGCLDIVLHGAATTENPAVETT